MKSIYLVLYKRNDPLLNDTFEHIIAENYQDARDFAQKHNGKAFPVYAAGCTDREFNIPTYKIEIGKRL